MNKARQPATSHEMEMAIGNLLRAGVIIAAAIVCAGGVIYLVRHGSALADYSVFRHGPSYLCTVRGILGSASSVSGRGLIQLGILLLIATPIARVALAIYVFARKRDNLYVAITAIVFCILMYSILSR